MEMWRLLDTGALDGPANMAVDEALLACFDPQRSPPVLRLYGWSPPAISIGRFQKPEEMLDLEKCSAAGIAVVRRITGGGAIYHAEELTYSLVCAPRHVPVTSSIKDSFRVLTRFLLDFYQRLGLSACHAVDCAVAGTRLGERSAFCFAGRESYDILIEGKKIGGNAQRRLKSTIFQHGSIPLINCTSNAAGFVRDIPAGIGETAAALYDFTERYAHEELKKLLTEAFAGALPARLTEDQLTGEEQAAVSAHAAHRQEGKQ